MNRRTRKLFGIRFKNLCRRWGKILEDGLPLDNVEIIPDNPHDQEICNQLQSLINWQIDQLKEEIEEV